MVPDLAACNPLLKRYYSCHKTTGKKLSLQLPENLLAAAKKAGQY
jgi:hypothetical protein